MDKNTLIAVYLVAWGIHLAAVHAWAVRRRLPHAGVLFSHVVESGVAVSLLGIFVLGGGSTVVQGAAGSAWGELLWSLWSRVWPLELVALAGAGLLHLAWVVFAAIDRRLWPWLPVAILGLGMCGFGLLTVSRNFPTA